jgi:hypothetical protein
MIPVLFPTFWAHLGKIYLPVLQGRFIQWLKNGAPRPTPSPLAVTSLKVEPGRRVAAVGSCQQLRVLATYADGRVVDVTHWAKFNSLDESVLKLDADGLVRTIGKGQGAALIRFEGQAAISTFVVPLADSVNLAGWVDSNFIDTHAANKFREIGIDPSGLCDDATFLRRASLDVIGTLPTAEQAKAFLESSDPEKRKQLLDRLLGLTGDSALNIHDNDYAAVRVLPPSRMRWIARLTFDRGELDCKHSDCHRAVRIV